MPSDTAQSDTNLVTPGVVYDSLAAFAACVGQTIGTSHWMRIEQTQIDQFAQATGDMQWIHVDAQRAAAGPFGSTIAHGFLTLSLLPQMMGQAFEISGSTMGVNYGLNKVRFITPVRVGSRVCGQFVLLNAIALEPNGYQFEIEATVMIEGHDKPACVAQSLVRRY